MVRFVSLLLVVTVMLALTVGCQSNPFRRESTPAAVDPMDDPSVPSPVMVPGLQLAPDQRFSDVPLPEGLKEDMDRTYIYESASVQVGKMVYTTKASQNELAEFYIRECPAAGWKLESVIQADGADLLFRKPDKILLVAISTNLARRRLTLNLIPGSPE
jgi:hypothetical protein